MTACLTIFTIRVELIYCAITDLSTKKEFTPTVKIITIQDRNPFLMEILSKLSGNGKLKDSPPSEIVASWLVSSDVMVRNLKLNCTFISLPPTALMELSAKICSHSLIGHGKEKQENQQSLYQILLFFVFPGTSGPIILECIDQHNVGLF